MWFFTKDGFYSAVTEERGKHKGKLVVRARETGAIELLRHYMPELTPESIGPTSDYRYRAWIEREAFAEGLARIGRDIDYSNFKSEVAKHRGYGRYEKALHQVWTVMAKLQPGGPYGTGGKNYPAIPKGEKGEKSKVVLGKSESKGQGRLPISFSGGLDDRCDDCGEPLEQKDGELYRGRWLCKDIAGCTARTRA